MKTLFMAPEEWSKNLHIIEDSPDKYFEDFKQSSGIYSAKFVLSLIGFLVLITLSCMFIPNEGSFIYFKVILLPLCLIIITFIDAGYTTMASNRMVMDYYRKNSKVKGLIISKDKHYWSKAKTVQKITAAIVRKRLKLEKKGILTDKSFGVQEISKAASIIVNLKNSSPQNAYLYKSDFDDSIRDLNQVLEDLREIK